MSAHEAVALRDFARLVYGRLSGHEGNRVTAFGRVAGPLPRPLQQLPTHFRPPIASRNSRFKIFPAAFLGSASGSFAGYVIAAATARQVKARSAASSE